MKNYDVIIIGAGPAGIITGVTVKKQNPEKSVLMIREEDKGLVPCGIPYIFHQLKGPAENMMGPKPFIDAGGEVVTNPVTKVDVKSKVLNLISGEQLSYEKLVFATGSLPTKAAFIKGAETDNVFYIKKSHAYMQRVFEQLEDKKRIVIIGGGFIGAEVAEQLAADPERKVSLIEAENSCFSKAFSENLSRIATEQLKSTNVQVHTSCFVDEIISVEGKVSSVKTKDGEIIETDAVILSIGYTPNVELAKAAGLPLNEMGAIIVDGYERTPVQDVYAVGDCSQTLGFLTGRADNVMLASTATAEARVLGYNLFGIRIKKGIHGTLGVFSTKINGFAMAAAGLNERNAAEAGVHFVSAEFSDINRHPGKLADAMPLSCKLYASPSDGTILGGEAWGADSAGELINIIAMAIQKSISVYELVSYQIGTHPLLTSAPTKPIIIKAAEQLISKLKKN